MNALKLLRNLLSYAVPLALCLTGIGRPLSAAQGNNATQRGNQDEEVQMGQQVFDDLKAKGEIIESSPLYDTLRPIADAIT